MTAEELKQRGYCCGMKCKECPYFPKYEYGNTVLAEIVLNKESLNFKDLVLQEINKK
jgi:hypothetical protein